jgi:hypothetical protein
MALLLSPFPAPLEVMAPTLPPFPPWFEVTATVLSPFRPILEVMTMLVMVEVNPQLIPLTHQKPLVALAGL